jgi:hypothetical protein
LALAEQVRPTPQIQILGLQMVETQVLAQLHRLVAVGEALMQHLPILVVAEVVLETAMLVAHRVPLEPLVKATLAVMVSQMTVTVAAVEAAERVA